MGISNWYFQELHQYLKSNQQEKNVLCLGYPDLLVSSSFLTSVYELSFVNSIPTDTNEQNIKAWHKSSLDKIFDIIYILNHHNFRPTVFDSIKHRDFEEIVNLNEPLPDIYKNKFNLVIDTGTLEHCFNVGQAFKNMCDAVALNGVILTAAPVTKLNHGYWNFCPLAHRDGFELNGFQIVKQLYVRNNQFIDENTITKKTVPLQLITLVIAKKIQIKEWIWPIQRKYAR